MELATVLIVKFRGDKVCHEHIYWDQGSALKQIGVLDAGDLPVAGAEAARKVLDEHLPSNIFMQAAWLTLYSGSKQILGQALPVACVM